MKKVTFDVETTKDPLFKQQLKRIIAELESEYRKAMQNAHANGRRLKASPLQNLMQQGKFTPDFIMSEFPRIADKKSTLPSSQRDIIGTLVYNAAKRTVMAKQAERARQIEEKANERVSQEETTNNPGASKE